MIYMCREQDTTLTLFWQHHYLILCGEVESYQATLVCLLTYIDEAGCVLLLHSLI